MTTSTAPAEAPAAVSSEHCNDVRLVGRLSSAPEARELPSGDVVIQFRLCVDRPSGAASGDGRDVLDCAVWAPKLRRTVAAWQDGDLVEVSGAVRRRFWRSAGATQSRTEIEVATARRAGAVRRPRTRGAATP